LYQAREAPSPDGTYTAEVQMVIAFISTELPSRFPAV
jgi:hypothetical protein